MKQNNHTICTACDARLKSLERMTAMILEKMGMDQEALAVAELEAVLDECNGSLNFSALYEHLKNKHKDAEVPA